MFRVAVLAASGGVAALLVLIAILMTVRIIDCRSILVEIGEIISPNLSRNRVGNGFSGNLKCCR